MVLRILPETFGTMDTEGPPDDMWLRRIGTVEGVGYGITAARSPQRPRRHEGAGGVERGGHDRRSSDGLRRHPYLNGSRHYRADRVDDHRARYRRLRSSRRLVLDSWLRRPRFRARFRGLGEWGIRHRATTVDRVRSPPRNLERVLMNGIVELERSYECDDERVAAAVWPLWGTQARLVVTDAGRLAQARVLVADHLAAVELACSRFRADSELTLLARRRGQPTEVSVLLADLLRAALTAADRTDGDVDPTVGAALVGLGYDCDLTLIDDANTPVGAVLVRPAEWSMVTVQDRTVTVPDGVQLDLGATAKAAAADQCAWLVAKDLGCGVLVSLGGDIATAGPAPADGWQLLVQDGAGEPACRVSLPAGAALATSSTLQRRWIHAGRQVHHVLDPRSGRPADPIWRTVSVAASSCLAANTLTTASLVRGHAAAGWLEKLGLPARLVDSGGWVRTIGGWPDEPCRAA
ncbi:Thiamin biosynthesis lipoprotein ApbE [Rhodococcus wratislaviensis]|uniref:FAD:protein FMN transferase n=2 Tax=Rhodococcus wratislaviensis TaxID=44752 RepID=A0A402CJ55_RHOWR|nr:Thiamin biosynthesis lipoprotein ApbE [Rhodococcus wratislaviensis]